jgi:prepilin-type N-terminal cleavage/methylation domain-containing protein
MEKEARQNPNRPRGFTLIELVVVLSLIAITFFLAIPRFENIALGDNMDRTSRWIIAKVNMLKAAALRTQIQHILHVDMDTGRLWISDETMTEDMLRTAVEDGYRFGDKVRLQDVEYPLREAITSGEAHILFYKSGYSDKVIIHIENEDHEPVSFLIEPFLPNTKIYREYLSFEE